MWQEGEHCRNWESVTPAITISALLLYKMSKAEYVPYCYSRKYVRDPIGIWYVTSEKVLIQSSEILDTFLHAPPDIHSDYWNNHHDPSQDARHKSDPPAPRLTRKTKNKNKFNTTCRRCGSNSHRSKVCPVYPWSNELCNICHRFHHTDEHKDLGHCWVMQFVIFLVSRSSNEWWKRKIGYTKANKTTILFSTFSKIYFISQSSFINYLIWPAF